MNVLLEALYCVTIKILFFFFSQSMDDFIGLGACQAELHSWEIGFGNDFVCACACMCERERVYVNAIFHPF